MYLLFLKYCQDKNFMGGAEIARLKGEFSNQLLHLCHSHNKTIVEKESAESTTENDFLKLIKHWRESNRFDMAKDEDDKNLKHREALEYDGFLCLRTKPLMDKINQSLPKAKLNHVIAQLVAKKVLKSDSDRNTAKIKGIRFLKIPLDKL